MQTQAPKQILLVEDSENDLELTQAMLAKCGATVQVNVVRDGEEALEYLHRRGRYASRPPGEPAVVLLDLKMPKVSGLDVLNEIKADGVAESLRSIPVVMLTSSREVRDLRECYRLGANGYVVKPVDAAQFMQAIKNLGAFWAGTNEPPPQ